MFCANCGTKQNEGEKFCPNCGTKFDIKKLEVEIKQEEKNISDSSNANKENLKGESVETKSNNKYLDFWNNKNKNNLLDVSLFRSSGIISTIIEEYDFQYDVNDSYEIIDESKGVFEFLYILDISSNQIDYIWKKIEDYNKAAQESGYSKIITEKSSGLVKALLVRKKKGLLESLFSWNPEYDFKQILKLCEQVKKG